MALAAVGLKTQIWNNQFKSILLLAGFPVLLMVVVFLFFAGLSLAGGAAAGHGVYGHGVYGHGGALSGWAVPANADPLAAGLQGVALYGHWALLAAALWLVIAFFFHQSMINAATGAQALSRQEAPEIYNLLENLCISRGVAMPRLYIIESPVLNAYASGISERSYAITLTRGIVDALGKEELEAVIGHELTHILNRDVRLLVITVVFVGMVSFLCQMMFRMMMNGGRMMRFDNRRGKGGAMIAVLVAFLALAVGYVFSLAIRFALSRRREYLADAGSVELTKNPDAMIAALRKISGHSDMASVPDDVRQMFIDNRADFIGLFATHPPIEKRIAALVALGGRDGDHGEEPAPSLLPHPRGPWG